jgi:hypothetical protein
MVNIAGFQDFCLSPNIPKKNVKQSLWLSVFEIIRDFWCPLVLTDSPCENVVMMVKLNELLQDSALKSVSFRKVYGGEQL